MDRETDARNAMVKKRKTRAIPNRKVKLKLKPNERQQGQGKKAANAKQTMQTHQRSKTSKARDIDE